MISTQPHQSLRWFDTLLPLFIQLSVSHEELLLWEEQQKECSYRFWQCREKSLIKTLDYVASVSDTGHHYLYAFYQTSRKSGFFQDCVKKNPHIFYDYLNHRRTYHKLDKEKELSVAILEHLPMDQNLSTMIELHYQDLIIKLSPEVVASTLPYTEYISHMYIRKCDVIPVVLRDAYYSHLEANTRFISSPPPLIYDTTEYHGLYHPYRNPECFRMWTEQEKEAAIAYYKKLQLTNNITDILNCRDGLLQWLHYQPYDERFDSFYEGLARGFHVGTIVPWSTFHNPDFRTILQGHCRWKDYAKLPLEARQFIAGDAFNEMEVIVSLDPTNEANIMYHSQSIPEIEVFYP